MNKNTGFRHNFVFVHTRNQQYRDMIEILKNLKIEYREIKYNEQFVDEGLIYNFLSGCENGFDDIIKNTKKTTRDNVLFDDLKVSELVKYICENPTEVLKSAIFLGKNGTVTTGSVEDDYTIHIPYHEREMSKIYG